MKRILIILVSLVFSIGTFSQNYSSESNTKSTVASPDDNVNFRLFQTNNRWTFLKLDTRNGVITHVQYSTENRSEMIEYSLNSLPLVEEVDAKPGRFFLYPTENTYNFILLDQIDGRVWQVQWSIDADSRGIWRIYYLKRNTA